VARALAKHCDVNLYKARGIVRETEGFLDEEAESVPGANLFADSIGRRPYSQPPASASKLPRRSERASWHSRQRLAHARQPSRRGLTDDARARDPAAALTSPTEHAAAGAARPHSARLRPSAGAAAT
jgi:hypothetical protein